MGSANRVVLPIYYGKVNCGPGVAGMTNPAYHPHRLRLCRASVRHQCKGDEAYLDTFRRGHISKTWYVSDWHFFHAKVSQIRGFTSIEEHDEAIIQNHNSMVGVNDIVWMLGDVCMRSGGLALVSRLNGKIHLITGNHDAVFPGHKDSHKHQRKWLEAGFESVQAYARRRIADQDVLLSHFPYANSEEADHTATVRYPEYRLRNEGMWLVHGHTHMEHRLHDGNQIHIGLDAWNLQPVPTETVEALIRSAA